MLAITLNGTQAVRLAITFKGTDACKVPELLFQHIYIEEHILGIQESEFQEGKIIGNLIAGYFLSLMVFVFVGLFLKMSFFKVWRYSKKKLLNGF